MLPPALRFHASSSFHRKGAFHRAAESRDSSAVEQARIFQTGHDAQERIQSRRHLRRPLASSSAKRGQADINHVRKALTCFAAGS